MNVLNKFTKQNLKLNKKRTIVTIIGVALSTALICAVAGMITSFQQTLINMEIKQDGNYHVSFKDVPKDGVKYIENNVEIKSYYCTKSLGWANLEESKNKSKPYIEVREYDKAALENAAVKLLEGRLPENSQEIVIPEHIKTNARIELNVGDTITLDLGKRQLADGTILDQSNSYLTGEIDENGNEIEEQLSNKNTKTYKIVGIIERLSYGAEAYISPGYVAITYLENIEDTVTDISVLFNNPKKYAEVTDQIKQTIKEDLNVELSSTQHKELLGFQGAASENIMNVLYYIGGIVVVIIVISSIFVIRNSFNISVAEKNRQYGMMASVGGTSKQIKKSVLFEGVLIGIAAIPIGIICGIIAIIILLALVNYLLKDMLNGVIFIYSVPIIPILLSIAISAITIYLSCIIPARRASKISPIEAIRGNNDINIKSKKIKTSKLIKKIFGIGGTIASKNLKRSRKKYRTTVISIVVSIVIFISLSSFMQYGKKTTGMYYVELGYNMEVCLAETLDSNQVEIYKKISKLDNIEKYSYTYSTNAKIDIDKYGTEYGKEYYNENVKDSDESEQIENQTVAVIGLYNEYFKEYIRELGLNENNYKNTVILIDDIIQYNEDNTKTIQNYFNVNSGDTVNISINNKEDNIKIDKKTDKRPMGFESTYNPGGMIFVSEDFFENRQDVHLGQMYIKSNNATELENKLLDLEKEDKEYTGLQVVNYETYAKQESRMVLVVAIFLYGFITVISLIGITNIFNTISTNMILRSKEFAMLKSVGMTKKEFNNMIRLESILYGLKALIIGIPIGILGSYWIYKAFTENIDFGFMIPWHAIIISVVFVFIIIGFTMKYSLGKINKQNIIETIRKDNI